LAVEETIHKMALRVDAWAQQAAALTSAAAALVEVAKRLRLDVSDLNLDAVLSFSYPSISDPSGTANTTVVLDG